uniref:Calpain catalytic domain-containing protein n=1 Tax=Trichobilharzia regenti TaxID=157069 RepID=A0AA85J638_TRIRE|nr:unnamed protein product [Trichobilharzia regenti]
MTSKKSPNNVSLRKTKEVIMTNQSATPREATVALWPEWNDQDVNSEKWDSSQKPKEKTKSPAQSSSYFIDPETQVLYPPSIVPACTRRPQEFITDKTPVVYDPECVNHIDLLYCNEHLFNIEILRWITCEIQNLWLACRTPVTTSTLAAVSNQTETNEFTVMNPSSSPVYTYEWKPWEHIYAMTKITKDNVNTPQYNPYGKYIVKLYWMGCWRKIIVDDLIPFDEEDRPLLPQTKQPHELWPMLLTKALLKIASVDCRSAYSTGEMGDFSTIQCLTGWIKHTIVVKKESTEKLWDYLSNYLTDWERPDDVMKRVEKLMKLEQTETTEKVEHRDVVNSKSAISKEKSKDKKGGDKSKESAKEKKDQTTAHISSDEVNPKIPETLLFASFKNIVSSLACLTASESKTAFKIKEFGFTCSDAYPICVAKRRVIPIIPPSPEKPTPTWKLIRPRPPDFPFNSCDNQSVTDKEKEPIRSLLLWTPVQEHIFYEPEKIVANPSVSTAESSYTSGSSPDTGRQTAGAVKGRSGSQGPLGRRRKESATTIQSSTKYPKRASREDIHKKGSGGKSKEVKGGNLTETVGSRSSNSLQLSRIKSNAEETASEILPVKSVSVTSPKEIWLDISDFCEIFRTVDIYHKPNTYSIVRTHSNLKPSDTSPSVHYLLCDSIHPCEIILQLSVVYQWPLPVVKTFSPSYSRGFSYIPETEATITVPTNEHHSTHNLPVITTTSASYTGTLFHTHETTHLMTHIPQPMKLSSLLCQLILHQLS